MIERGQNENRKITDIAAVVIALFTFACFCAVWLLYYNGFAFRTHRFAGAIASLIIYYILYRKFADIYSAFKIASFHIVETAFAQGLSFGLADLLLYVGACLAGRAYIPIWPVFTAFLVQLLAANLWAAHTKQYFLKHVKPKDCLLLYDDEISDINRAFGKQFAAGLEHGYGHLFNISRKQPIRAGQDLNGLFDTINAYDLVFLYELPLELRSEIMQYCIRAGKSFYLTPTVEDVVGRGYDVKHLTDKPLYAYNGYRRIRQTYFGKRALDIAVGLLMLVLASPFMLVTAVLIKLEDGGSVFFRQDRCTQGGRVFKIIKFRSMRMDAEKDGRPHPAVSGDPRITRVGRFIRKTRIDELPQIFNVLKGDMSIVGPRPERVEHVELYTAELPEFSYRMRVKAGLTGYAQVYGKYNTTAYDKLLLDLMYIEQQSLTLDVKLFFLTFKIIFIPESTEGFEKTKSQEIREKSRETVVIAKAAEELAETKTAAL